MPDRYIERLAQVAVEYSTEVRPGDLVLIESTPAAAPLLRELHRRVLAAGGHPYVRLSADGAAEALLRHGSDAQLEWLSPARTEGIERADVRIFVEAEENTHALTGVDPARQAVAQRASKRLGDRIFERAAAGELRWLVTLFPTQAAAQDAGMALDEYERFVYAAGLLDREDPVAEWRALGDRIATLAARLGEVRELRVVAEGTDLRVGVEGRTWIASRGKENLPDGEVFTGPVETSLEGTIRFTFPAAFHGRVIEDIELRFEGGEVVDANASSGADFLQEMLGVDDGARRVGEFAFGLNDAVTEFTLNTLFDEKIGGTMHMALGKSYPETGGVNASALHWDLVCDLRSGSEVYADGELVYRDGAFLNGLA